MGKPQDLTGGFKPTNTLRGGPHLQKFIKGPNQSAEKPPPPRPLMSQSHSRKRASDNMLMDHQPAQKKKARSNDSVEDDSDTEVTEVSRPQPNTSRGRTQSYRYHPSKDPFVASKPKMVVESVDDSDTDDGSHMGKPPTAPKGADVQKTTFASAKNGTRFKIHRAACLNSTYDHKDENEEKQIYLVIKDQSLRPCTREGSDVANYEWLEIRPGKMKSLDFCPKFSPLLIIRPGGVNFGSHLHLELASSDEHNLFLAWIRDRQDKLPQHAKFDLAGTEDSQRAKQIFERAFAASQKRSGTAEHPEDLSPQQPIRSPPAVSSAEKEKPKQKLAQSMKANQPAAHTSSAAAALDKDRISRIATRSSRRSNVTAPEKLAESSNVDLAHSDDDGLNSIGTKKASRRSTATKPPASPRWVDSHPNWTDDWDDKPLIYPPNVRDAAQITKEDIPRLEDKELLNDSLIIFSSRFILSQQEKEMPSVLRRTYIFNPWFYKKLSLSSKRGIDYEAVKSWTSKVDLFAYDFVVVPVNENFHWYLAIICYPGKLLPQKDDDDVMMIDGPQDVPPVAPPSSDLTLREDDDDIVMVKSDIVSKPNSRPLQAPASKDPKPAKAAPNPKDPRVITFDSLGGAHSPTCTSLRDYLVQEAKHRHNVDIKPPPRFGLTAKGIPEQNDFNSCGAYLLGYLQKFFQNPDQAVDQIVLKQGPNWEINPKTVREEMRTAIMAARKEQNQRLKSEKETKERKRQAKAERLKHGMPSLPSSPLPETQPSGTKTSAELQQNAKDIESDRLSRGNVTGTKPRRMVQDQEASQGELAAAGSSVPAVAIEEPTSRVSTEFTAAVPSRESPQVISDNSTAGQPRTCTTVSDGGPTESSSGRFTEVSRGSGLHVSLDDVSSATCRAGVQEEPVHKTRRIDGFVAAVVPQSPVLRPRSTPSFDLLSSPLPAGLHRRSRASAVPPVPQLRSSSPTLEVYTQLLAGQSHHPSGAVETTFPDSETPSRVSEVEAADEALDVSADEGHLSEYYTASETTPDRPSNALDEDVQQHQQGRRRKRTAANDPVPGKLDYTSSSRPGPRIPATVTSSYFVLDLAAPSKPNTDQTSSYFALDPTASSKPNIEQTCLVEQKPVRPNRRSKNPFVHKKTTSAERPAEIDLTKGEEETTLSREKTALAEKTVDLTRED